jgi:multidrug efflux pump subunit AcrB
VSIPPGGGHGGEHRECAHRHHQCQCAGALGIIDGDQRAIALESNAQLRSLEEYKDIVIKVVNGTAVRLASVATVEQSTRNARSAARFNHQPRSC